MKSFKRRRDYNVSTSLRRFFCKLYSSSAFGIAGVALILFSIISLSTGRRLTKDVKKIAEPKKPISKVTALENSWHKIKASVLKFFRWMGLFPKRPIYDSFHEATRWLKSNLDGTDYAYEIPWYLLVGEEETGKTTLINNLSINQPSDPPTCRDIPVHPSLEWHFFDKGVVLDVSGSAFLNKELINKYHGWKEVIKNLYRFRPRRPVDGIILTIPATNFIGPTALKEDVIFKRASDVAEQLRKLELKVGLKLPIYVVMTQCDQVAGFSGFCNSISPEKAQEIFGWSSPYNLDEQYSPQWVHNAFQDIAAYLTKATLDIFEQDKTHEYQDDIMVLAPELAKAEGGLTKYLSSVFQAHNYREHFFLRGIYCTGNAQVQDVDEHALQIDTGNKPALLSNTQSGKIVTPFINDLFEKKIFGEANIATPIKKFLISTNHKINYMKALILLTIVGSLILLQVGKKRVADSVQDLYPDLIKLSRSIHYIKLYDKDKSIESNSAAQFLFQQQAEYVLNLMVKTEASNLKPYFLPASLLTNIDNKMIHAIKIAYDMIITQSMYLDLMKRADHIISYPLPTITMPFQDEDVINPLQTTEFIILQGYVDAIQMLERSVSVYNKLKDHPTIDNLAYLSSYLYNFTMRDDFIENSASVVSEIIRTGRYQPINLDNYKLLAMQRLYKLYMSFIHRILDPAHNYRFAERLQKTLNSIDNSKGAVPQVVKLKEALHELKKLEKLIASPDLSWIGKNDFNPGTSFETVMSQISSIQLFGHSFIRNLSAESLQLFLKSKKDLKSYGSPLTGYFFTESSQLFEPSAGVKSFEQGLDAFLKEPFMQETSGQNFLTRVPNDHVMYWDGQLIKMAKSLVDHFQKFLTTKLPTYPPDVQEAFRIRAQKQLQKNINDIIARAQKVVSLKDTFLSSTREAYVMSQIENINEVGSDFLALLQHLRNSESFELYVSVRDLIFQQMYNALINVDKLLSDKALYEPFYNKFTWWKGDEGVIYRAFDMLDHDGMKDLFENQLKQVQALATTYAEPLVKFLSANYFNLSITETKIVEKWKRILNQLTDYQKKKSTNTVSKLEHFMLESANEITFANCFTKISHQDTTANSTDFFLQKLAALKGKIYQQCQALAGDHAVATYSAMADFFNVNLAGQFPFAAHVNRASLPGPEVTPDVVKGFFDLYDTLSSNEKETLYQSKNFTNIKQVKDFLEKIKTVKEFLDTYFMPRTDKGKPGLNFHVEFRANQMHEVHGNHILDWGFAAGDNTFDLRNGRFSGRWEVGQIAAFAFKWANDSPLRPLEQSLHDPAYVNVSNRAIYMYEGQWSLLRALMLNQATIENGGVPNSNTLLTFTVPLSRDPRNPIPETHAHLYVRFIPQTPKVATTTPFKIPTFPTVAPVLQRTSNM